MLKKSKQTDKSNSPELGSLGRKDVNLFPIHNFEKQIVHKVRKNEVVTITGPTACGKTTQVPQMLLDRGLTNERMVAITQPRRIAAISLAKRVADERYEPVGYTVGYAVRFQQCYSEITKLKFMTDGYLLREVQIDPLLGQYSIVVMDEVHERTLNTDLLLGVLRKACEARNGNSKHELGPLKVIIMSATMDLRHITNLFPETSFVKLDGVIVETRKFDVDVFNLKTENTEYVTAIISKICELHNSEPIDNHILAFLPGREEISTIVSVLKSYNLDYMTVLPLYAALSHEAQVKAISKSKEGYRRVVISTNIAETSLTIPGITIVLDSGFVKRKVCVQAAYSSLQITRISQAEACQRSGRAGREREGTCYRFYTNDEFRGLQEFPAAEIERGNITKMVLNIVTLGVTRLSDWPWLQEPHEDVLRMALKELKSYNAIESVTEPITLTPYMGDFMAYAPVDPVHATFLLHSTLHKLHREMASIVAVLSTEPFLEPCNEGVQKKREVFYTGEGDLVSYAKIMATFRASKQKNEFCRTYKFSIRALKFALRLRKQIIDYIQERVPDHVLTPTKSKSEESTIGERLRKILIHQLPFHVATLDGNVYRTRVPDGQSLEVKIHPNSSMIGTKSRILHFVEITQLGGGINYIQHVSPVEPTWVQHVTFNHFDALLA